MVWFLFDILALTNFLDVFSDYFFGCFVAVCDSMCVNGFLFLYLGANVGYIKE